MKMKNEKKNDVVSTWKQFIIKVSHLLIEKEIRYFYHKENIFYKSKLFLFFHTLLLVY